MIDKDLKRVTQEWQHEQDNRAALVQQEVNAKVQKLGNIPWQNNLGPTQRKSSRYG